MRSMECVVCTEDVCKYKCPRCSARTCSLSCCKEHKRQKGCDGVDRVQRLRSLDSFTHVDYWMDYRFLEQADRRYKHAFQGLRNRKFDANSADERKREFEVKQVLKFVKTREFRLVLLPKVFEKHHVNQSHFDKFLDTIFWTVKLDFVDSQYSQIRHGIPENVSLQTLLRQTISPRNRSQVIDALQLYRDAGEGWAILMQVEQNGWTRDNRYFLIDGEHNLRTALRSKIVVEFPTLIVALRRNLDSYPILTEQMCLDHLRRRIFVRNMDMSSLTRNDLIENVCKEKLVTLGLQGHKPQTTVVSATPRKSKAMIQREARQLVKMAKQSRKHAKVASGHEPARNRAFSCQSRGRGVAGSGSLGVRKTRAPSHNVVSRAEFHFNQPNTLPMPDLGPKNWQPHQPGAWNHNDQQRNSLSQRNWSNRGIRGESRTRNNQIGRGRPTSNSSYQAYPGVRPHYHAPAFVHPPPTAFIQWQQAAKSNQVNWTDQVGCANERALQSYGALFGPGSGSTGPRRFKVQPASGLKPANVDSHLSKMETKQISGNQLAPVTGNSIKDEARPSGGLNGIKTSRNETSSGRAKNFFNLDCDMSDMSSDSD